MPLTFFPHKWVPLKAALRRIMSITETYDRALHYLTRDLCSGQLRSALEDISPDGKETVTLLNPSDWQQRTERNYAHADSVARRAMLDLAVPSAGNHVVVALKGRGW